VIRILIILWADQGRTIARTAELLGCCEQTVLNWRRRFLERRSEGAVAALMDLPRSVRPPVYDAQRRVQIVATVCEILHQHQAPLSRFSTSDLHRMIIVEEESLIDLSRTILARILAENALKP
jgi:transposase-like protein